MSQPFEVTQFEIIWVCSIVGRLDDTVATPIEELLWKLLVACSDNGNMELGVLCRRINAAIAKIDRQVIGQLVHDEKERG